MKNWRRTKRKKPESPRLSPRHPFLNLPHPTMWALALAALVAAAAAGRAGQPVQEAGGAAAQEKREKPKKPGKPTFLVFGTMFTERGFALPGAEIEIRAGSQRKPRWKAQADRRGEFALRVPPGAEYEVTVRAAGYSEAARKVDARSGSREDLVFRLEPAAGGKP